MKLSNLVIIFIPFFILISCGKREEFGYERMVDNVEPELIELDENLPSPFHLKEVKRVETPLGGYPKWLKTPKENELILLYSYSEKGGHGVLFYDNELNLTKRKIIKKGEGPGEADYLIMTGSKDKLYLINKIKKMLTIFDHDLNILKEKKFQNRPGPIDFFGVALNIDETKILHCFTYQKMSLYSSKRVIRSYTLSTLNINNCKINNLRAEDVKNDTKRQYQYGWGVHWLVNDDFIYFVDLKNYIISKMDFNGKVLKKIKINHKEKEFSQEQLDAWMDERHPNKYENNNMSAFFSYPKKLWSAAFIFKIKDGFAIARREDYAPKEREYITADYFTWDMEFKGKIKLPAFESWNTTEYCHKSEGTFYYKEPYFYTIKQEEEADFIIKWEIINGD